MARQFQTFGLLVVVLAACGGVEPSMGADGGTPLPSSTREGVAGMGMAAVQTAIVGAAGAPAQAMPEAPVQADPQPSASEPQAGTGGAAGSSAGAGAGGSSGSPSGTGGVGGAGGNGAARAGAGGGAAGSAGPGGSGGSTAIDCPLGAGDADGNGYPDACEKRLWSVGYQVTDFTQPNVYYRPDVPVFLVLSPGGLCPGAALGDESPLLMAALGPQQDHPDARIFDAVSDATASGLAECLRTLDTASIGIRASLAPAGSANDSMSAGLPNPSPLSVQPHLVGKHILYFRRDVSAYDIAPPYMGQKGTRVLQLTGGFSAVGY